MPSAKPSTIVLAAVGGLFLLLMVGLVASSLVRPEIESFVPTPPAPEQVGEQLVGPLTYTVDATAHDRWVYFDFSSGSVVQHESRRSLGWDIAFQRHRMITNGGDTNGLGLAGVLDLGPVPLDSSLKVPGDGYLTDQRRGDGSFSAALEDWYDYSWTSHLLRPAARTFAIRTADGNYAVLRFVGYYCPGGRPGCVTFRYRYRGNGDREFPEAHDPSGQ